MTSHPPCQNAVGIQSCCRVQELPPVEAAALAAAAEQLSALCGAAGDFGIPEPAAGGWAGLEARVHAIALGQAPPPPADAVTNGGAAAAGALHPDDVAETGTCMPCGW